MVEVRQILYVDAHYSYEPELHTKEYYTDKGDLEVPTTSVHFLSAHGYVARNGDNIIIAFIKEKAVSLDDTIKNGDKIIKGLVITDSALISAFKKCDQSILEGLKVGTRVAVTWRDVVYVANLPRYDCSIMYTEGTLFKIEKDHIVLKETETLRTHPMPAKNHPAGRPMWYTIPISFIKDIEDIS
jgi:hypothetical protein